MGGFCLAIQRRKLPGGGIVFHLTIPVIVGPAAQFGEDFCALFQRQFSNGVLDFLDFAHAEKMPYQNILGKPTPSGISARSQVLRRKNLKI
jgi:hypothetical protein